MTGIWDYGDDSGAKDPSNCNSSSWGLHVLWPPQAHVCTWYTVTHTGACIHINSNNRSKKLSAINSFPLLLPSVSWVLAMPSNPGLLADPLPSQTGSHTVTACEEHCQAQHRIFLFVSRLTEALEHKRGLSFVHGPVLVSRTTLGSGSCLVTHVSLYRRAIPSSIILWNLTWSIETNRLSFFLLSAVLLISWNSLGSALHYFWTNQILYWTIAMLECSLCVSRACVSLTNTVNGGDTSEHQVSK